MYRRLRKESLHQWKNKLLEIDSNVSMVEMESKQDLQKLDERKTVLFNMINIIVDEHKRSREEVARKEITKLKEQRHQLEVKLEYLEKCMDRLDANMKTYSNYDVIKIEQQMMPVIEDIESINAKRDVTLVRYVPGDVDKETINKIIGKLEVCGETIVDDSSFPEVQYYKKFENAIRVIAPISDIQAWTADMKNSDIKLLSLQKTEMESMSLPPWSDFIALANGDFILTDYNNHVIRRISSTGKVGGMFRTEPLHPTCISKSQTEEMLVTLRDDGHRYNVGSDSRRVVQRMTLKGKVLHRYSVSIRRIIYKCLNVCPFDHTAVAVSGKV